MAHTLMMQAVRVHEYGGPGVLRLDNIPVPAPEPGEVQVRVHAAGVLPAEVKTRAGLFHSFRPMAFPYIPGSAISGVISAVGEGVTDFATGDSVFGRAQKGAYAEYITTLPDTLALKPDAIPFVEAAAISGGANTAWQALFDDGDFQPGQRVLIHAGAGGVGAFAVQFAHWKGAHVIATASGANTDFVRSLGADQVVDYTSTRFEDAVRDVDLVLDTIGGEVMQRSMQVVKRGGRLITLLGIPPSEEDAQTRGIIAMNNTGRLTRSTFETIGALIADGTVRVSVGARFSLHEVRQAHALVETGHGSGRVVLEVI